MGLFTPCLMSHSIPTRTPNYQKETVSSLPLDRISKNDLSG